MTQRSKRSNGADTPPLAQHNTAGSEDSLSGTIRPAAKPTDDRRADAFASHAIRVLCVDDHAVLVEGLRARFAIHGAIEVVGGLGSATRLLEEVARLRPNAVILDIEMPGPDAFEMADRLKRTHPQVRVIVLSAHIRDSFISAAFAAGASGFFAKSDELNDIIEGIHEVMRMSCGTFILGPKVRERCRPTLTSRTLHVPAEPKNHYEPGERTGLPVTRLASLTPRETEVLRMIGKGLSRVQIAAQICRSAKTVDAHQGRMMKKLGIGARTDLIRFAIREGLVTA